MKTNASQEAPTAESGFSRSVRPAMQDFLGPPHIRGRAAAGAKGALALVGEAGAGGTKGACPGAFTPFEPDATKPTSRRAARERPVGRRHQRR